MEHPAIEPEKKTIEELLAHIREAVDPQRLAGKPAVSGHLEPAIRLNMLELLAREGHCLRSSAITVFRTAWLPSGSRSWESWDRFADDARRKVAIIVIDIGEDMQAALARARKLVERGAIHVSVLTTQMNFTAEMLRELVEGMDLRLTHRPLFRCDNERVKLLLPSLAAAA